jgi:hypothetical protein
MSDATFRVLAPETTTEDVLATADDPVKVLAPIADTLVEAPIELPV